jgi:hypothetical protein
MASKNYFLIYIFAATEINGKLQQKYQPALCR